MAFQATLCGSYAEVGRDEWNALLAQCAHSTPFLQWEFLHSLESTACTTAETGWQPTPLIIRDDQGCLIGATPLYVKSHSYGEYVFDWAWAQAYERAGLEYFPKFLVASPFSPIPGARFLAPQAPVRAALADALKELALSNGLSSAHVLFPSEDDLICLKAQGWLVRDNVQFHWHNLGYQTFDDYLASMSQPKRKKIKAERRKVRDAGITTQVVSGADITADQWAFFYACYSRTYDEHRSTPYMSLAFFLRLASEMPESVALCLANRGDKPIAAALLMQGAGVLYGRYWGAMERVDCLHFEVAYYTPIEWAIGRGFQRFEGGAQGEHKLARGFTPVKTYSAHWIREPAFQDAVARFLLRESQGIEGYVNELESRSPLRS